MELELKDGRLLDVHSTGDDAFTLLWHNGSPHTGALLDPLVSAAEARGIRLVSYARPSYGGSSPKVGRSVASAAGDVEQIADALGIARFAVMGYSGGGPHALACAALMPDRVTAAVSLSGVAPFTTSFDWYAGMHSDGALRAAAAGRPAREEYAKTDEFDPESFTAADSAALERTWASLGDDAVAAGNAGPDGLVDDDMAAAGPWGFDVPQIQAPVLIVHGGQDRVVPSSHGDWLARNCPTAEYWFRPRDGHVTILDACPVAMDWLLASVPDAARH